MHIIDDDTFARDVVSHIANKLKHYQETYNTDNKTHNRRALQLCIVELLDEVLDEMRIKIISYNKIIYIFNGHYWVEVSSNAIHNIVSYIYNSTFNAKYLSPNIIQETLSMITSNVTYLPLNMIDKSYLNFYDGVYDVLTGKRVGNSDMFFFKNCLNYNFSDVSKSQDCPNFRKFLYDICWEEDKNDDYIKAKRDVILSFMCYALFGELKIERALVLYGGGSNGKSTLLNIIRNLYGDHNISSVDIANVDSRTKLELFEMQGKMLNMCSELRFSEKSDVDIFKRIVSKEHISARRLYSPPQEINDFPVQIFATNSIPHFGEIDDAIIRRLTIIEFKNTFSEDPHFIDKFKDEYPAILKYVLSYIDAVGSGKIVGEDKLRTTTRLLLSSRNSIDQFLLACGDTFGQQNALISLNAMYSGEGESNYVSYCRQYGYRPYSFNVFCEQIKKILKVKVRTDKKNKRIYHYISNAEYFNALNKLYTNYKYTESNDDLEF